MSNPFYLITGTTGIAAATALRAVRAGAAVHVASRSAEHVAELVATLRAEGGDAAGTVAELTRADDVERLVADAWARCGRVDGLYNVAGISGRRFGDGPIHECTDQGWDTVMDANVRSMFLVCRAAVGRMLAQSHDVHGLRGTVLNMASVLGKHPQRDFFATHAYAASKGAILSLSRAMAATYAPEGIRVNAIAPGLVRTPMSRRAQDDPAILAHMRTKQPLAGGLIDADEVAKLSLFLLDPAQSAMVTGDILSIDAGWGVSG